MLASDDRRVHISRMNTTRNVKAAAKPITRASAEDWVSERRILVDREVARFVASDDSDEEDRVEESEDVRCFLRAGNA